MRLATTRTSRALAAIQCLREIQREQARVDFARALDRQRSAERDHRVADERATDQATHAEQAFSRQPDVRARKRWLEHLQALQMRRLETESIAAAAASAADVRRRAVMACDSRLKAAQALGKRLDEDRDRVEQRRAARVSDALWLARHPSEEAPW